MTNGSKKKSQDKLENTLREIKKKPEHEKTYIEREELRRKL